MQPLTPTQQQVIALSAIFQAALLVDELAQKGQLQDAPANILWQSILIQNPQNFMDIYPQLSDLRIGIQALKEALNQNSQQITPNVGRYVFSLLHLEKKVSNNTAILQQLSAGIERAARQAQHFSIEHSNMQASLAETYKQSISQMNYRIKVSGNVKHLQSEHTANKVRSLLLAGIRATNLWRQVGGKRWHFIFKRKQLLQALTSLPLDN